MFNKNVILYGLILAVVFACLFWLVIPALATQQKDNCDYTCPTVHFEWETKECPNGYYYWGNGYCEKNGNQVDFKKATITNHSADVKYDKSNDPNKCHRPSDNDLSNIYGMDHDARQDFKSQNSEWKDSLKVCPTPTNTPIPTITPTDVPVSPTVTPSVSPTATPTVVTPTPTDGPKGDDSGDYHPTEAKAPAPVVCTVPFEVARVWYNSEELKWATDAQGIQKFSLVYGPTEDTLIYGVDNIPSDARSIAIPDVSWQGNIWFSIWTWVDNCANQSQVIDP